jgi:hypothetical protein
MKSEKEGQIPLNCETPYILLRLHDDIPYKALTELMTTGEHSGLIFQAAGNPACQALLYQ